MPAERKRENVADTMERKQEDYGCLIVSLDFELMWGILDHSDLMAYKGNIESVWDVIAKLLELFERHQMHVGITPKYRGVHGGY